MPSQVLISEDSGSNTPSMLTQIDSAYYIPPSLPIEEHYIAVKLSFDEDAGAIYIKFRPNEVSKTIEFESMTLADLDEKGVLVGLEILFSNQQVLKAFQELMKLLRITKV